MRVEKISFDQLCDYWRKVNHFNDPNKKYDEVISRLGHHVTPFRDPPRASYGLFDGSNLIGATHLVKWNENWLRMRTINIRAEYRGRNLGQFLLQTALEKNWRDENTLFGWFRDSAYPWALKQGFLAVDHQWQDQHIAMTKPLWN